MILEIQAERKLRPEHQLEQVHGDHLGDCGSHSSLITQDSLSPKTICILDLH